jgi:hypothetical protein
MDKFGSTVDRYHYNVGKLLGSLRTKTTRLQSVCKKDAASTRTQRTEGRDKCKDFHAILCFAALRCFVSDLVVFCALHSEL